MTPSLLNDGLVMIRVRISWISSYIWSSPLLGLGDAIELEGLRRAAAALIEGGA
ncbi:MAG: hypothetical protein R3D62_08880 [Xanthobacteraceae bacterium]